MRKTIISLTIVLFSAAIFAQTGEVKKSEPEKKAAPEIKAEKSEFVSKDPFSPQAQYSDRITVSWPSFSKKVDPKGKGEILEVLFSITKNEDKNQELYVFVVGTIEDLKWITNSFGTKKTRPEKNYISFFTSYPDTRENYEYDTDGKKELRKFPKDYKKGINPATGKAYIVSDKSNFRVELLSEYRKYYRYFNNVYVFVYDNEGKVLFRQGYELKGVRTR